MSQEEDLVFDSSQDETESQDGACSEPDPALEHPPAGSSAQKAMDGKHLDDRAASETGDDDDLERLAHDHDDLGHFSHDHNDRAEKPNVSPGTLTALLKRNITELRQDVMRLEDENNDLKKQVQDLQSDKQTLVADNRQLDVDKQTLVTRNRQLDADKQQALRDKRRVEAENLQLVAQLRAQNDTITNMTARHAQELRDARGEKDRKTKITWKQQLRSYLDGTSGDIPYKSIYKQSCKDENMSSMEWNIHPNLKLRKPNPIELENMAIHLCLETILEGLIDDVVTSLTEIDHESTEATTAENHASLPLISRRNVSPPAWLRQPKPCFFRKLPPELQVKIISHVLTFPGKLIHCISRLDPYLAPLVAPSDSLSAKRTGLLNRFHIGSSSCSISNALKPNELLALFLVCKNFYFIGAHAFYGGNTFAFSSMGEFGRFSRGIGPARLERIQRVELLWIGNQHICFKAVEEEHCGKQAKYTSRRTWDASYLCEMPRLRSLIIHVPESSRDYMRRQHENGKYVAYMAEKTLGQPNFRNYRALRTLQGLDYILQLRGLENVMFYDFSKYLKYPCRRHPIRDWTFFMDVDNNVKRAKPPPKEKAAQLRSLKRFLQNMMMPSIFYDAIRPIYERPGPLVIAPEPPREPDATPSAHHTSSDDSDSESDGSSSSDTDPGSDSGGGSGGGNRSVNTITQAASNGRVVDVDVDNLSAGQSHGVVCDRQILRIGGQTRGQGRAQPDRQAGSNRLRGDNEEPSQLHRNQTEASLPRSTFLNRQLGGFRDRSRDARFPFRARDVTQSSIDTRRPLPAIPPRTSVPTPTVDLTDEQDEVLVVKHETTVMTRTPRPIHNDGQVIIVLDDDEDNSVGKPSEDDLSIHESDNDSAAIGPSVSRGFSAREGSAQAPINLDNDLPTNRQPPSRARQNQAFDRVSRGYSNVSQGGTPGLFVSPVPDDEQSTSMEPQYHHSPSPMEPGGFPSDPVHIPDDLPAGAAARRHCLPFAHSQGIKRPGVSRDDDDEEEDNNPFKRTRK